SKLGSWIVAARMQHRTALRIADRTGHRVRGLDLILRQAVTTVLSAARQGRELEVAFRRILDDAVVDTVQAIALVEDGIVDDRILARWDDRRRRSIDVGVQPDACGVEPHLVPRR